MVKNLYSCMLFSEGFCYTENTDQKEKQYIMDIFESWSPEYAVNKTLDEIKVNGLDGLKNILQQMLSRL